MNRSDLERQIKLLKERSDALRGETFENLFPVWVLLALATPDEDLAAQSICGGPFDQGLDAIFIDSSARCIWIVQGKTHKRPGRDVESIDTVRSFARLAERLCEDRRRSADPSFWQHLERNTRGAATKFAEARKRFRRGYEARLVFASLGRFSQPAREHASWIVRRADSRITITLLDWKDIERHLHNYVHDVAPAVPELRLRIYAGNSNPDAMGAQDMQAWTVAVRGSDLARLLDEAGERLFARNIRGYLGDKTRVNKAIRDTIRTEPHRFWFLNNGVTIMCNEVHVEDRVLRLGDAQVINGQQTIRTLHDVWVAGGDMRRRVSRCIVGVRVIDFRGAATASEADRIIADIVEATNHQNAINEADLRANDLIQINLERALAARGYLYIRKRSSAGERAGHRLSYLRFKLSKEKLAVAVGAALHESVPLREGQAPLFDPHQYYPSIFENRGPDFLLMCWWLWRYVERQARGDTERQAAKFIVQYHAFQNWRSWLSPAAERFIKACESSEPAVIEPLELALESLFRGVHRSYMANRRQNGRQYAAKPYFQSREVDAYKLFLTSWENGDQNRRRFERASETFRNVLTSA